MKNSRKYIILSYDMIQVVEEKAFLTQVINHIRKGYTKLYSSVSVFVWAGSASERQGKQKI